MSIEILRYRNSALFKRVTKKLSQKPETKLFVCFSLKTSTFKRKCETNDKSCFSAKVGRIKSFDPYLEWTCNCILRLMRRYDATFYPHICIEFIGEQALFT